MEVLICTDHARLQVAVFAHLTLLRHNVIDSSVTVILSILSQGGFVQMPRQKSRRNKKIDANLNKKGTIDHNAEIIGKYNLKDQSSDLPQISYRSLRQLDEFAALKPKQLRFIIAMVQTEQNVSAASRLTGIWWSNHYNWQKKPEYIAAMKLALRIEGDKLLSTMLRDANHGRAVAKYYQGKIVGFEREVNAQERIHILDGLKEEFRPNYFQQAGNGPTNINIFYPSIDEGTEIDVTPKPNDPAKLERP